MYDVMFKGIADKVIRNILPLYITTTENNIIDNNVNIRNVDNFIFYVLKISIL